MPSMRRIQASVGALVLVGAALLTGVVLFLTGDRLRSGDSVFETYSRESVQGLETGSPVRYRGVQVGRVTEIGLASAEYRRTRGEAFASGFQLVFVRFAVDLSRVGDIPSLPDAVNEGLRARLATQGITGVVYIELDYVDPERFPPGWVPWEPRFPVIPAQPSTTAQVQSAAETLLRRFENVDVTGILENLNGLLTDLRSRVQEGDITAVLRDASALLSELRGQAQRADLPGAVDEIRGAAAGVRGLTEGRDVREALAALNGAMADLRRTTQVLPRTVGRVNATIGDVQADLAPILRDLRAATSNLRETTEALRRSPSQLLLGAPPPPDRRR
ncbi:MlaD family protein [Sabulicella glaciei]|uniref:MlaD family protein n=1 Tax=Sabulicella glaciei TaxID=2984948 RepID=A0ABT3P156_9PROT|nr:MlaD family protein [Roseococcus sp. MDT2-1-1]MCW8088150.1 MlaD family protein [Roseococcus sp. MDT2-1-1]